MAFRHSYYEEQLTKRLNFNKDDVFRFLDSDPAALERAVILRSICTVATLLHFNHSTELSKHVIYVQFIQGFRLSFAEKTTNAELFTNLVQKTITVDGASLMLNFIGTRTCDAHGATAAMRKFLEDPIAYIPDELKAEIEIDLNRKVNSINRNLRNYESESDRRARERKNRAIEALSTHLAQLNPSECDAVLNIMRTSRGQYEYIRHIIQCLEHVTRNLQNWCDEEVMEEAKKLAAVKWTMDS